MIRVAGAYRIQNRRLNFFPSIAVGIGYPGDVMRTRITMNVEYSYREKNDERTGNRKLAS